ncbi:hypothetical protein niasHT_025205 [Heterodera trifolii]|uniref:Ubiquitin-like domain-containing protein n=1 Tax=Heterodera trifolii TaxID=157864 RepID=A0ABD2JLE8_9BILA
MKHSLFSVGISAKLISMLFMLMIMMMPTFNDAIKIHVKFHDRREVYVTVNKKDTVEALKEKIAKIKEFAPIPAERQTLRLFSTHKVLENNETMEHYGIEDENVILVSLMMQIRVLYDGKTRNVKINENDPVAKLKKKIAKIEQFGNIPAESQMLTMRHLGSEHRVPVNSKKTMERNGIKDGDSIIVSLVMQIRIKYGDLIRNVEVNEKDTVATLKEKIAKIEDFGKIPAEQQTLKVWINSQVLENDNETMGYYGVEDNHLIIMFSMKIRVQYGDLIRNVEVNEEDTVATLKEKIAKIEDFGNMPGNWQTLRLSSNRQVLENDNETLKDYMIKADNLIVVSSDMMKIFVIYARNGKQFPLEVKTYDTVAILKQKIQNIEQIGNIPAERQTLRLSSNRQVLENNNKTLASYGIEDGDYINVSWDKFKIFVKYENKVTEIEVNAEDTVESLKEKFVAQNRLGISSKNLQLYFNPDASGLIDCQNTIDRSGIVKDGTVYLSPKFFIDVWKLKEKVRFIVKPGDTVQSVKERIKEKKGAEWNCENGEIILSKDDKDRTVLEDNEQTLEHYGIGPSGYVLLMG